MKKLVTEFIGTFFLVLAVQLCVLGDAGNLAPIGIGAMLMIMVFAGGHISGAHYNPAITMAVFLRGKCAASDVPGYIFSQFLGASLAALMCSGFLFDKVGHGIDLSLTGSQAILAEALGTFAWSWVVLNVATSKDTEGNSFYGLAIGMTLTACAFAFGPISGGAFNPAVAFSLGISNISGFNNLWIYIVGEIIGAVAASYVFLFANGRD
ncbi:MAG: aquaporin [Saprospiraceae bacterium]